MLDTHGRKYVQPLIERISQSFIACGYTANQVTCMALVIGVLSGVFIYLNQPVLACIFLWTSGLLDAVDGSIARYENHTTPFGTLMDITFDRVVEISVLLSIGILYVDVRIYLLILMASIILSMTIFLTVGALAEQRGIKSFYYQAGVAERTEGFILLTIMILFNAYLKYTIMVFFIMVMMTAIQRMVEGKRILNEK